MHATCSFFLMESRFVFKYILCILQTSWSPADPYTSNAFLVGNYARNCPSYLVIELAAAWVPCPSMGTYIIHVLRKLQNVQVAATRSIPDLNTVRLRVLNLCFIQRRLLRVDLIQTFKLIMEFTRVDPLSFYSFRRNTYLRDHQFMLENYVSTLR